MSVGRRRVLLPLAFLGLAAVLAGGTPARAQQPAGPDKSHRIWIEGNLTSEQIRAALARLGQGELSEAGDADQFRKMLNDPAMRDRLAKQFPDMDRSQLEGLLEKVTKNPQLLEQAKQLANQKQTDPGRPGKLSQDDLNKLFNTGKGGGGGGKGFTPPGGKFPPDMKGPPGGKQPPDVPNPTPPKVNPMNPPGMGEPPMGNAGNPAAPANPGAPAPPPSVNEELFRPPDDPTDPRSKSLQAFAAVWERNIGPLDQTPEVKKALFDIVSGTNGLDLDITDDKGNSIWDLLRKGEGNGLSFGEFMEGGGGNWHLPNLEFPSFNLGRWWGGSSSSSSSSSSGSSWWNNSSNRPRPGPSGGSGGGSGGFGFGGSWFPVIVLGVIVLGIFLWMVLKNLRDTAPAPEYATDGLGPWPIDPRQINTREDVVKAFEYLSVLICGPSARTWTHSTIADALSELAATHGETAVMLARLYELARYAPLDEPLTRDELMEARELVCGLAGVPY